MTKLAFNGKIQVRLIHRTFSCVHNFYICSNCLIDAHTHTHAQIVAITRIRLVGRLAPLAIAESVLINSQLIAAFIVRIVRVLGTLKLAFKINKSPELRELCVYCAQIVSYQMEQSTRNTRRRSATPLPAN